MKCWRIRWEIATSGNLFGIFDLLFLVTNSIDGYLCNHIAELTVIYLCHRPPFEWLWGFTRSGTKISYIHNIIYIYIYIIQLTFKYDILVILDNVSTYICDQLNKINNKVICLLRLRHTLKCLLMVIHLAHDNIYMTRTPSVKSL